MGRDLLETDADLRKRVEQRFDKRKEFAIHAVVYGFINGGLWLVYLMAGSTDIWPLTVSLGWGAGFIAHAIDTWFEAGAPARARDQALWRAMRERYGEDWRERASRKEYKEMQEVIKRPYNKRKEFASHFGVYAAINLMLWLLYLQGDGGFPWPLIVSVMWGLGLATHAADTWFNHSQSAAIEREVQRERERLARETEHDMKRKRDTTRLQRTVDGDILEIIEEPDAKAKRR